MQEGATLQETRFDYISACVVRQIFYSVALRPKNLMTSVDQYIAAVMELDLSWN